MAERSSVAQVSQIGVETTPGTAVAATKRLGSMSITPSISAEVDVFRPTGLKFASVTALNKEWAEVSYEGAPTYDEVVYPLSGAVGTAAVAQVLDGATPTGAYEWTFTPASAAADVPKTFTLESGQAGVQAEKFAHMLFTSFGLEINRGGVTMSGSGFAQKATTGITPTAGLPIPTGLTPIMPGQFAVYQATSAANLNVPGSRTTLARVVSASPSIEDRYTPSWFLDATAGSFSTFVENADGAGGSTGLTLEADAAGMSLLATLRAGDTTFLRIEAAGPNIYNAGAKPNLTHLFQWDMALKVESVDSWGDEDGIYAIPWSFKPVHDSTWGKAMQILVRNKVSAL